MNQLDIQRCRLEARMLSKAFVWSVKRGYDSEQFIRTVMTSEWGIHVMNGDNHSEWADELFLLSGFEEFVGLKQGECYSEVEMEFMGYLYKYWVDTKQIESNEVYKIAPPSRLVLGYNFLHTQCYDYVIDYLTEEFNQR